jgi:hypothetical protein
MQKALQNLCDQVFYVTHQWISIKKPKNSQFVCCFWRLLHIFGSLHACIPAGQRQMASLQPAPPCGVVPYAVSA